MKTYSILTFARIFDCKDFMLLQTAFYSFTLGYFMFLYATKLAACRRFRKAANVVAFNFQLNHEFSPFVYIFNELCKLECTFFSLKRIFDIQLAWLIRKLN